jgi:hypothetical protein
MRYQGGSRLNVGGDRKQAMEMTEINISQSQPVMGYAF